MRRRRRRLPQPGLAPGTLTIDPEAHASKCSVIRYGAGQLEEVQGTAGLKLAQGAPAGSVVWVNVEGLADVGLLRSLAQQFGLHPLTIEDIVHVRQRPKVEDYERYQFIVLRTVSIAPGQPSQNVQFAMVVGDQFVLSFHEREDLYFTPVRDRLRKGNARLRQGDSGYLAYSLLDACMDGYFPVLEAMGERTESLQEEALLAPTPQTASNINQLRRDLLDTRRAIWPLRDELNKLLRAPRFAGAEAHTYLRDVLDHSLVALDLLESLREISGTLMDLYLSSMSNRMNEVMKWLTIVSTIFIPLTFVTGLYGMNFQTETSPYNMPELRWYWGYPVALLTMLVTALATTLFIWRKGWFRPMVDFSAVHGGSASAIETRESPKAPLAATKASG